MIMRSKRQRLPYGAVRDIDEVYVPIGCGSGICGLIAWRDALGIATRIIGVVADRAPCYALSFEAGKPVATESADTFADGMAVRVPVPEALGSFCPGERFCGIPKTEPANLRLRR